MTIAAPAPGHEKLVRTDDVTLTGAAEMHWVCDNCGRRLEEEYVCGRFRCRYCGWKSS